MSKVALFIDDDIDFVVTMARSVRAFTKDTTTEHQATIEGFFRANGLDELYSYQSGGVTRQQLEAVAKVLERNSCFCCDNNLEGAGGCIRGLDFLIDIIAPAIKLLPEERRPTLICFAPSSESLLKNSVEKLLALGIDSYHKINEAPIVGLALAINERYKCRLNRKIVLENILGLKLDDNDRDGPKQRLCRDIWMEFLWFSGESFQQVAGPPRPIDFDEVLEFFAKERGMTKEVLIKRIENEALAHPRTVEGKFNPGKEKK